MFKWVAKSDIDMSSTLPCHTLPHQPAMSDANVVDIAMSDECLVGSRICDGYRSS
jgi:hypothetical protein